MDVNHLPGKLVKLRKHFNYSQAYLAEILGVDVLEYMGYENGRAVLNYAQMKKLASFYHADFADIFSNSEDIDLPEEKHANTDELNINYFIPKRNIFQKAFSFLKKYRIVTAIALFAILFAVLIGVSSHKRNSEPFEPVPRDSGRLSVSETSLVYIDESGAVRSAGDDSNGQLDSLPEEKAVAVAEGGTFTIVLDDEGNLHSYGLGGKTADEIASWKRIIDVACGDGHILALDSRGKVYCAGENGDGQCNISSVPSAERVYASSRGSVIIGKDGRVYSFGEFFASSMLKNYSDIRDIDSSEDNTVIALADGQVKYYAKNRSFHEAETWNDIVDVSCGNDFIAGLDSSGKVHIDIDSYLIRKEVSSWENVIAIDAGDEYLVAYDGETIRGIGKNTYHQFEKSELLKIALAQVSDVHITILEDRVVVSFAPVAGASGYLVSVDAGIGLSQYVEDGNEASFDAAYFHEGLSYSLSIITRGDEDHEDSDPLAYSFTYVTYVPTPPEELFTVDDLIGKTKTNFEAYLKGLDYDLERLTGIEEGECQGSEAIVTGVNGLYEKESITKSELQQRQISYTYCKVTAATEEPVGEETSGQE